jgi:hypothetical protein
MSDLSRIAVDQSPPERGVEVEPPARQRKLGRALTADPAGQADGSTGARDQSHPYLWKLEKGFSVGNNCAGKCRQLDARPHTRAVHGHCAPGRELGDQ